MTKTKINRLWFVLAFVAMGLMLGAWMVTRTSPAAQSQAGTDSTRLPQEPSKISSLGRIEPKDGVVRISARSISGQPSIIAELKVSEGDWVKTGQVIAILDSRRQLEAVVNDLEARVTVAQERVAMVKAGPKKADIAAQQAEIARLEAILAIERADSTRYDLLYTKELSTATDRDQRRTAVESTTQMLNQAKNKLLSLQEIRDADVTLAEAEVQAATASVSRARTESEAAVIHAPVDGRVLKIVTHAGEEVGPQGIVELGRTDQMYVIAEVVESDVSRVKVGQDATIRAEAFQQPLRGKIDSIGLQVARSDVLHTDPATLSDARVVEVKIRLDDNAQAARLIHGQVTAVIEP